MITTGEHEYTRYGFRQLLTRNAAGTSDLPFSSTHWLDFTNLCVW